jgi:hypothetical protein
MTKGYGGMSEVLDNGGEKAVTVHMEENVESQHHRAQEKV